MLSLIVLAFFLVSSRLVGGADEIFLDDFYNTIDTDAVTESRGVHVERMGRTITDLRDSPVKVQKYVLREFAQLFPRDVEARRAFVQSGGLQALQELNEAEGGKLSEFIVQIHNCFPPEVVENYSPNYSKTLLQKVTNTNLVARHSTNDLSNLKV